MLVIALNVLRPGRQRGLRTLGQLVALFDALGGGGRIQV